MGGIVRAAIVVFGALAVMQSSQELNPAKIIYLGVAAVAVSGSIRQVWRTRFSPLVAFARPWLAASIVVTALMALSLPVALVHGTPFSSWFRDAAAYAIVAAAPWVAIDLATAASRRLTLALLVITGELAAASYTIVWIQRRALADLPIDRVALPSFTLAMVVFAVSIALSIVPNRGRYIWSAVASITIGLLIVAGTRTTLALLIIPPLALGATLISGGNIAARRALLPALIPVLAAAAIVVSTQVRLQPVPGGSGVLPGGPTSSAAPRASVTPSSPSLGGRYDTFGGVIAGRDFSLQERLAQTRAAWEAFLGSPIVGEGLGAAVPWVDMNGVRQAQFTADTPVLVLSKFGVLGLVLVGAIGWAILATIRGLKQGGRATSAARLSLIAVASGVVALTPFGWQLEDKGTGLAIILVLGFALTEARDAKLISGKPTSLPKAMTSRAVGL
jgi:hypothetical protein